jgi:hypothetical protein
VAGTQPRGGEKPIPFVPYEARLRVVEASITGEADILALLDTSLEIRFPQGQPTWSEVLLGLTLIDLLGRLFPRIGVRCDRGALVPAGIIGEGALLLDRAQAIREHAIKPLLEGLPGAVIGIGSDAGPADIYADGSGWQSYVGPAPSRLSRREIRFPVGPLAAACRAAARVFSKVMNEAGFGSEAFGERYWSDLTYTSNSDPIVEPDLVIPSVITAVLVGVGSIGGAVVYLLRHVPGLAGSIDIVDPERLEEHNPIRALLARADAALSGDQKAHVADGFLREAAGGGLHVRAHEMTFAELVAARPREASVPLVLAATDSIESRREIQDGPVLDSVNAACTALEISVSGHRTGVGACLYCLYLPQVLNEEAAKKRIISRATGMSIEEVTILMVGGRPLSADDLRRIEQHRRLESLALAQFEGHTINDLYEAALRYGEADVRTEDGGLVAVGAPFVTALAGFLQAAEALKHGSPQLERYRLGPLGGIGDKYSEALTHPSGGFVTQVERWPTHECLCRSARRLRLIAARYGVDVA